MRTRKKSDPKGGTRTRYINLRYKEIYFSRAWRRTRYKSKPMSMLAAPAVPVALSRSDMNTM